MKKRKFIILAIVIIAAALLLEGYILKYVNDKNSDRTSKVLLDRVITVLDKNDASEENLIKSLYTISVLSFLNSFKVFREAWLVAGDYPQQDMYLLQHLYNNWFRDLAFDKISAAAVLTALVVCVLILLLQRAWEREI